MKRSPLLLVLSAATVALIAAVWLRVDSVNGPAEWRWALRPAWLTPGATTIAIAALLLLLFAFARRAESPDRHPGRLPILLIALGAVFQFALVAAQPGGFVRVTHSVVLRNSFGFLWDAGLAPSSREILADFPTAAANLNQHSRTHPPGPLLAIRALDRLVRAFGVQEPELPDGWKGRGGGLVTAAARAEQQELARSRAHGRVLPARLASAWTVAVLAILLPLVSALSGWPLYRLALAWELPRPTALLALALWLLVPARILFTPSLDQALPFLLVAAVALAARPGMWSAFAAGGVAGLGCFLTYGYLTALPLLLLIAAAAGAADPRALRWRTLRFGWKEPLLLGLGFLVPWLVLAIGTGYEPIRTFQQAISEHLSIAVVNRDYWTWIVWNPYDFILLTGPLVLGLALAALWPRPETADEATAANGCYGFRVALWGFWALLALLLVQGSVRGEVGRIWLMWMPFACLFAARAFSQRAAPNGHAAALAVLLLQAALGLTLAANLVFVS